MLLHLKDGSENLDEYNSEPVDMLLRMPGITWKNYKCIVENVQSLKQLTELSERRIEELLGNQKAAHDLYKFLHEEHLPDTEASGPSSSSSSLPSGRPRMHLAGKGKRKAAAQPKLTEFPLKK
ncbi:DNA repair endonuclease XPF [Cichlidogyrus casuarinus]|uniref:DNA repair endonuclease XPF n=1 Tax=Cichlidogyrus casuarinus TaxID=1844966 RepID=A0ABD2Q474_9PLAT